MDWDDVRYFLALARVGSVRAAGAALGVSHSTVARRVEALEAQLGARLFDRHRDGYLLTDAGAEMFPGAERVEREMSSLERALVGRDTRLEGAVRLTCTDAFLAALLLRDLAGLCARHPELELELDADAKNLDLSKREADLAVRALAAEGTPPEHLVGRKLVPIVVASYVAVEHEARLDPSREGSAPRWLGSNRPRIAQSLVASSSYADVPLWGVFASMSVMVDAAREGLGLVILPTYVGDPDPALRRIACPDLRHVGDFWLLGHPDLRDNTRVRAARDCVSEALRRRASLFRGEADDGWSDAAPLRPADAPHE